MMLRGGGGGGGGGEDLGRAHVKGLEHCMGGVG